MSKLGAVLLSGSLIFNAMFAVGYFRARTADEPVDTAERTDRAAELLAEKLGLDDDQKAKFIVLHEETRERGRELRDAAELAQQELWVESCGPESDPERVQALETDLFELRRSRRELGFDQFRRFLEILTPEQRDRVQERLRRHCPPRHSHGRFLERFDEDKDGKLSPDERAKAIRTMRERGRKFREGRPPRRHGEGRTPRPGAPFRGGPTAGPRYGPFGPGSGLPGLGLSEEQKTKVAALRKAATEKWTADFRGILTAEQIKKLDEARKKHKRGMPPGGRWRDPMRRPGPVDRARSTTPRSQDKSTTRTDAGL